MVINIRLLYKNGSDMLMNSIKSDEKNKRKKINFRPIYHKISIK